MEHESRSPVPVEVPAEMFMDAPTVDPNKTEMLQRRILDEMMSWNRTQRRNFVRRTGGFRKPHGRLR